MSEQTPTTFVIFGATGDLIARKLVPALFRLHKHKRLPKLFSVIGISRKNITREDFQSSVLSMLKKNPDKANDEPLMEAFASLFDYISGDFSDKGTYDALASKLGYADKRWMTCTNKMYYLAVPPSLYEPIIKGISDSGLNNACGENGEGYTRVVIEKPFGHDRQSAHNLHLMLTNHFSDDQVYKLDHYLGKRIIENILAFRFSNSFFDGAWSNKYIEKVEIKLLETIDASDRGSFYDSLGALRDVGQNHLLELLAITSMDHPGVLSPKTVRNARAKILERLIVNDNETIIKTTVRGQYEGYRETEGVAPSSMKETYVKLVASLNHPMWHGVPFVLEAGKSLAHNKKEIVITFKKPISALPMKKPEFDGRNKMLFKSEPEESIQLDLWAKQEGYEMIVEDKRFLLNERDPKERVQYTEEYEKLLLDAFNGNQTFFVSQEEVDAQWRFVDPIVCAFDNDSVRLTPYKAHSDEIRDHAKSYLGENLGSEKTIKEIGIVGLGKMGGNLARNMIREGYTVYGYNRSADDTNLLANEGLVPAFSLEELVQKMNAPKVIWLGLPHGEPTDTAIDQLSALLSTGDIVVDGGNSFYEDAQKHAELLHKKGIEFVDVGISGGPMGALLGACLMVGGNAKLYEHLYPLFKDISVPGGVSHFDGIGAGHFVKMIHNGIEYGMMQAIAEGFTSLGRSPFVLDLQDVASVYSHGSVVESRLIGWLHQAFTEYGNELSEVKGSVDDLGEGRWALGFAQKHGITDWSLKAAVDFRDQSKEKPDFTGKILSAIRGQFGGHDVK